MIVLLVLGIDTSGKNASVALMSEDRMLAQYFVETQKTHSQVILPLCEKMLGDLGKRLRMLTDLQLLQVRVHIQVSE